jgi:MYXO-CTERM domain-containing protein
MGCEADQLVPGASVTLAGYGQDDEPGMSGQGIKRWTVNAVEAVDEASNDLLILGVDDASVCYGDSGGPAYMQLDDGSWRVVGITSEPHPDVSGEPPVCGYGAVYDLVHLQMEWFEQQTGYDLTPCFDTDGTWVPDEDCGSFPTSLTTPGLSWGTACATDQLSDLSATCGDPFGFVGTSTGAAESTSTGDGDSTTGGGSEPASSSGDEPPPLEETTTSATGEETLSAAAPPGDSGCGCGSGRPGPWGLVLLGLILRGRRRRRRGSRSPYTPRPGVRR